MRELIINKPKWQRRRQRMLYGSLTALFWAAWVYLWMPALAFAGWILGVRIGYDEMVIRNGFSGVIGLAKLYSLIIALLGGALLAWAYYNYFRFRGIERRKAAPRVTLTNLSDRYGIDTRKLEKWSRAKRLVVHHNDHGRVVWAECDEGSPSEEINCPASQTQ
jgi:biofilm PGA synthesis protein PgaD